MEKWPVLQNTLDRWVSKFEIMYLPDGAEETLLTYRNRTSYTIFTSAYSKSCLNGWRGSRKEYKRQQAFNNAWKEILPYRGLGVPKQGYCEVTQWQGKEMCNLCCYISAVWASRLRNPDCVLSHDFKHPLKCISALVDFSLMAQYCKHTPDILA